MTFKGKAHQAIVARLLDEIRAQDSVPTISVKSDMIVSGKGGATHQIDVYWAFLVGTKACKCVITAQHWDKPVSQRELDRFRAVLADLPALHTGVFAGSSGYQKGARIFAESCGIAVYVFPFTIEMTNDSVTFFVPRFERVSPVFDEQWIEAVLTRKMREGEGLDPNAWSPDERTHLFDERRAAKTVREVLHEHYLAEMRETPAHEICVRFDRPTYIETGDQEAPILKVSGLDALFSITSYTEDFNRVSEDFAHGAVTFTLAKACAQSFGE